MLDPAKSWVAKWQRLDGYVPGVYAVKVVGLVSGFILSGRCCRRWIIGRGRGPDGFKKGSIL